MSISIRLARPEWAASVVDALVRAAEAEEKDADAAEAAGRLGEAQECRGRAVHWKWLADRFEEAAEVIPVPSGVPTRLYPVPA